MFARRKFQHSLNLVLVLFTTAICLLYGMALLWGVQITEDHIVKNQLRGEFRRFKQRYESLSDQEKQRVGDDFSRWLTTSSEWVAQGVLVYAENDPDVPEFAQNLPDGILDIPGTDLHYMADHLGPHRLILLFDEQQIFEEDRLESTLKILLTVFSLFLVILSLGVSLVLAKWIASPIARLNKQLKGERPYPPFIEEKRQDEIGELARTFSVMVQRLNGFLGREKQFTRHASHELRTPIAIIANSLSVLRLPSISSEKKTRNLDRIGDAVGDMNDLIETFLILGREHQEDVRWEHVDVGLAVRASLAKFPSPKVTPILEIPENHSIQADPALFAILLDNLLKNAITYSRAHISIMLKDQQLIITNDIGEAELSEGFGFGLEIIQRIVDRLGWRFETEQGTTEWRAVVYFKY